MPRTRVELFFVHLLISFSSSYQKSCESFNGAKVHDHALLGYSFGAFNTTDPFSCAQFCLVHDQCKSYNYALSGPQEGLCELNTKGKQDAPKRLRQKAGFVFVEVVLKKRAKLPKSCSELWEDGARISGKFRVHPVGDHSFEVHCDFTSETGWVWTLIMSQSRANRAKPEFKSTPFYTDAPVNANEPNWAAYRLPLNNMQALKLHSTHWRATCSLPTHGVDGTDYVRAKFSDFDPLTLQGSGVCKKVEYQNVRGHSCVGCTSAWWQAGSSAFLHHDSSSNSCEFGSTPGHVYSEDNFGFYHYINPNFRCSSDDNASTNYWFGKRV